MELVESHEGNAYLDLHGVLCRSGFVLHSFQKKSPSGIRTAKHDIALVEERLARAQQDSRERYGKEMKP